MGSFPISQQALPVFQEAQNCMQGGNYPGAIAAFTRVIHIEGASQAAAYAYHSRATAYAQLGNVAHAIENWTQALAIAPRGELAVDIYNMRASLFAQTGNLESAISDLSRIIDITPTNPKAYNRRAGFRKQKQDFTGAIADYSRAIDLEPQQYAFYLNRGQVRQEMSDLENALLDFDHAVRLEPRDADNYFFRGALYHVLGRLAEALKDMNEAVRLNASDPYHFSRRGQIRSSLGDFGGAISDFKQALQLNPSLGAELNTMLAEAYIARSYNFRFGSVDTTYGLSQALADVEIAIKLHPGDPVGYYARGRIRMHDDSTYLYPKQLTESARLALMDFGKAIQIAPNFPEPYADRATILQKYGRLREAFEDMKLALRLRPNQPLYSPWFITMQLIVNELADDGYHTVTFDPVFGPSKPGYNELTKGVDHGWDHYLAWRLQSKANRSNST